MSNLLYENTYVYVKVKDKGLYKIEIIVLEKEDSVVLFLLLFFSINENR